MTVTAPSPERERLAVVVVDDVELARRRNVVALEADEAVDVVAQGEDLLSLLPAIRDKSVDVAVVALSQRGVASPGTIEVARAAMPGVPVVVLVGPRDEPALDELGPGVVTGVVQRRTALDALVPAVRAAWSARPAQGGPPDR